MTLFRLAAASLAFAMPAAAIATVTVYRDPGCGCCVKWAERAKRELKREVRIVNTGDRAAVAARHGVPRELASCHTTIIDGMAFEGHVPIADVRRALASKPKGVRGLAVPGMPIGSPGMEVPGVKAQAYAVIAFGPAGNRVFARH